MKKYILPFLALGAMLASCENDEQSFPDYGGGVSLYFAYQYPVRTILLGEHNEINTDLDNAHQFQIQSAQGGTYSGIKAKVEIAVDNSLCDSLYYSNGNPVLPLPSNYYTLSTTTLDYAGTHNGKAVVTLTDAFFADPKALTANYVLPVVMVSQTGADHIRTGTPMVDGTTPARTNSVMWDPTPQDYMLMAVRYVNTWHGTYLVKEAGKEIDKNTKTVEVLTQSLTECKYTNLDGKTVTLTFNGNNCTITENGANVGSGEFKKKSEIKAWGNKDRDALYLTYSVGGVEYKETLVAQLRTTAGDPFTTVVEYEPQYKN